MRVRYASGPKRAWLFVSLVALALIAAACGGGGGGGTGNDPTPGGQQAEGRVIEMDSGEMYFSPSEITVKRGEPVTLVVRNSGALAHNISIDEFNIDRDYGVGQTIRVNFTPNRAGEFRIYCDVPGHSPAGMVATLIVED